MPLLPSGAVAEASLDRLEAKLINISRFYWADHDYDQQASFGDVKDELTGFGRKIKNFQSALGSLSTAAKYTIRASTRRHPLDADETLQPTADKLQALSDIITKITSRFVQIAMEAIDDEVTFASIRTKLIELDRERSAGRAATVADDDMA